jgi:hypothetical protein
MTLVPETGEILEGLQPGQLAPDAARAVHHMLNMWVTIQSELVDNAYRGGDNWYLRDEGDVKIAGVRCRRIRHINDSIEGPFLAFYRSRLLDGLVIGADFPRDELDRDLHWNGFRFYNVQPEVTKPVAPPKRNRTTGCSGARAHERGWCI